MTDNLKTLLEQSLAQPPFSSHAEQVANTCLLNEHNEHLNAIFDLSQVGIVSFDASHCVRYVNPAVLHMTGLPKRAVDGLHETAFVACLNGLCAKQTHFPSIEEMNAAELASLRLVVEFAGIGPRLFEVTLRESNTEAVSQILYLFDVSHEAHGNNALIASVARDLITPIANISGFAELMLYEEFSEADQHDFLNTICQQAELIVTLIDQMQNIQKGAQRISTTNQLNTNSRNVQHEYQREFE